MSFYIKLNGLYLQSDDRDESFFDSDIIGTPYKTTNAETAKELLSILCPIIPFKLFNLETVPTTKYNRAVMIMGTFLVWGTDNRWHNINDIKSSECQVYDSPKEAVCDANVSLDVYARIIL